jgi:hypothetical protein
MMVRHKGFRLALGLTLIAGVVLTTEQSATAEVFSCGSTSATNYHVGKIQNPSDSTYIGHPYEGVSADIVTRSGAVCDTDTSQFNRTNSYAMIASANKGPLAFGYAQAGFVRWYNHAAVFFWEYQNGNGLFSQKFGTSTVSYGSAHTYKVAWTSSCSCYQLSIDGAVGLSSNWNPYDGSWWYPFSPQFEGEATYKESDVPGNSSVPTTFSNVKGQYVAGDAFESYACHLSNDNDVSATRADGEHWYVKSLSPCPNFNIFTDTAGL